MNGPTFCQRLRELRKERHLSQSAFAAECRLSSEYVSMLERDLRVPGYWTLLETARFFGVSLDYLAGLSNTREIA